MRIVTFIKGAAIGAGLMYLFDPSRGRQRRAWIRDTTARTWNETGDTIEKRTRDLSNRAQGVLHHAAGLLSPEAAARRAFNPAASWMPANWSPTTRMAVTAAAGLLALYGKRKGGVLGTALGALSVGIITNSVSASEIGHGFAPTPSVKDYYSDAADEVSVASVAISPEHTPRTSRSY